MNRDMVRRITHGTPLLANRQHQVWITSEIHTSIWEPSINHLLTIEPLEEGLRKINLGLASMARHEIDPPLHPWFGRWRQAK